MNAKNWIAGALLIFVASSVVILVGREFRKSPVDEAPLGAEQQPDNALVVYYFHGETRCPTCMSIESFSQEAVESAFADELAEDRMQWKVVNYEQPVNAHFVTDYEIVSPTVVLVRRVDGKVADWRNLVRVWELVGDRDAFTEYVQSETRSMLGS